MKIHLSGEERMGSWNLYFFRENGGGNRQRIRQRTGRGNNKKGK